MKSVGVAALALIVCVGPSLAQSETGNDIRALCQIAARGPQGESELIRATYCQGFVRGILFSGPLFHTNHRFCAPKGVTVGQAINVLLKYLDENPERTHYPSETLTIHAFSTVWPCK